MKLQIITPVAIIFDGEVDELTAPSAAGEITVLSRHVPLFAKLNEGILTVRAGNDNNMYSIGGGYIETDGKQTRVLISRAFGQSEIDEQEVQKARKQAEELLAKAHTEQERTDALQMLRRSTIDLKLLSKVTRRKGKTN